MFVEFVRLRRVRQSVAIVLITLFGLAGTVPAGAQQSTPGGMVWKVCKPPPNQCLSKEGKEQWAKDNNCRFLEDVCSKTTAEQDSKGAPDADQGFWGDMWSGVKGGLVFGYEFVKGLMIGLKDQVAGIIHMITNIDEVVGGLIDLGKSFFTDPKGTLAMLADLLGQEAIDAITKATQCGAYDLGKVVGSYVSPAFALKLASKLTKYGGKLAEAAQALKHEFGCASFAAGTSVLTPQGLVPIERIQIGQSVLSRNEISFADQPQLVEQTFGRTAPGYRLLSTETETFKVTDEHPLWVQGKGWTEAAQIVADDVIASEHGDALVTGNLAVQEPLRVYNFSVANTTNYFVGAGAIWAHNATCSIGVKTKAWNLLTKGEKGFRGELKVFYELKKKKYKPVGKSFDPTGKAPEAAYAEWSGKTGIDAIYKDEAGNYVIIESKATGAKLPGDPEGCVAKLCKLTGGERQMSEKWINERLEAMVPDEAERNAIIAGLKNGTTKKVYAVTNEATTTYNEVVDVFGKAGEVTIGKTWVP